MKLGGPLRTVFLRPFRVSIGALRVNTRRRRDGTELTYAGQPARARLSLGTSPRNAGTWAVWTTGRKTPVSWGLVFGFGTGFFSLFFAFFSLLPNRRDILLFETSLQHHCSPGNQLSHL